MKNQIKRVNVSIDPVMVVKQNATTDRDLFSTEQNDKKEEEEEEEKHNVVDDDDFM